MNMNMTEDEVRDQAGKILKFENTNDVQAGVGQLTSFNQLGFLGIKDRPDGWYLPKNYEDVAIILETKSTKMNLDNFDDEVIKNCNIVLTKYKKVIGILYNGIDVKVFKNNEEIETVNELQNKEYYLSLFTKNKIDKQQIYTITKKINDCLHTEFGIKNLYHRMIFTACALVAKRYGAQLFKGMNYSTFHTSIHSTLAKSLEESRKQNQKLDTLLEVYSEIKMNSTENQLAIDNFIEWVSEISECVNSDYWNGEDVMGIFFNEFNRYKKKSESGQVFTPEHITSLMYRLINVHKDDYILDAACGSGGFLVKAMSKMIKEAGGVKTDKAKEIKANQLYGIEFDREIYALACANMLIHKDGKTNLEQLDTREEKTGKWIKYENPNEIDESKLVKRKITKVLMNPPFERKYGCMEIVNNVLLNVPVHTECAFILPDKKLEKDFVDKKVGNKVLKHSTLKKIIKLPEKIFSGVTTSIFIFEAGVPHEGKDIFACYIENDGLETVKNQGRHDIKDRWQEIENYFVDVIDKQSGDDTIQWINPKEHLSYQMPKIEFKVKESDFKKTVVDYMLFTQNINLKELQENIFNNVLYGVNVRGLEEKILKEYKKETKFYDNDINIENWEEFEIKDVFITEKIGKTLQVPTGAYVKRKDLKEGNTPRVTVSGIDNGIIGYYESADSNYRVYNNFISVSFLSTVFYQKEEASLDMKVHCLKPIHENLNIYTGLFIATIIRKAICNSSYSDQISSTVLPYVSIKLPCNRKGVPDYKYMEDFMKKLPYGDQI